MSANASVAENQATVSLAITRTDGSTGGVTVQYATADCTAKAGIDYTAKAGTLSFATGVTSQKISIPILNKGTALKEDRSFTIALSNPTGGASLGTNKTVTVTRKAAAVLAEAALRADGDFRRLYEKRAQYYSLIVFYRK